MACMILLRCIYRQAASCNGAGRSGNWKAPNYVGWGNWKARSPNFVGSPMCTVSDRSSMSTVSDGISSAAPWLMLPPSFEDDGGKMSYNLYSPVDKKVTSLLSKRSSKTIEEDELRVVGSSLGWLALCKGKLLFLYNPISDRQIQLPPVETIPVLEEKFRYCWGTPEKVILSCPPPNEEEESNSSCRAILCYGPISKMAVCCPGQSTEWTTFGAPFHEGEELNDFLGKPRIDRYYEDFVYSTRREQLFCVTRYGDLEAWDIGGDPLSPKLNWKTNDDDMDYDEENYPWHARSALEDAFKESCPTLPYLAFSEHSDQLFLVQRYFIEGRPGDCSFKTVDFGVHEIIIKEGGGELRYMDGSLNGMALFIGSEEAHGCVVESPCTMNLLPDSIYYTDPNEVRTPSYWNKCGGRHLVIFDYANRTFSPSYRLPGFDTPPKLNIMRHESVPTPVWFTPSPSLR